jgi:serine/threonine protein kinase
MGSKDSETIASLTIQQQIDACCQAFEQAWKDDGTATLEDYVTRVPQIGRKQLLRALLILEKKYLRGNDGAPPSDSQLCDLHPKLMPEVAAQLKLLQERALDGSNAGALKSSQSASSKELEQTIDHTPASSGSRGLHIRCPHCSNPVELLTDAPLESITCRTCGSIFSLVGSENETGEAPVLKKIGRFQLINRVGMGGFGTVWKARDTELDRTVAIKIPRKGQLRREEEEQFFREARSAAQLRHPNIVPVHEVGRDGDTIFIVSDLIRGVSLADWISGATPSAREVAELLASVADALHHAHEMGVIHRDLKPPNILLDDFGRPYVMDFGLAKREIGEITMTVDGQLLGTPAYMSPEQAEGAGHWTDRRTDIYSLGVILFRMLTGELPFRGNAQMQIHQRITEDPPDPRKLNRHIPRDLSTICLKCLERSPNGRYSTALELSQELRRYLRQEPILSRPISRTERFLRWAKRSPALATASALTVFLAIAGPVVAMVLYNLSQRQKQLLLENNKLINRNQADINEYKGQVDDLRGQLDVWEGKANPYDFWPPKREEPPRHNIVADVLNQSSAALANSLRDGKYDGAESARGYLGLAVLAQANGRGSEARGYYELAREQLQALRQQHPEQPQIARALADCHLRLAELARPDDARAAEQELQKARGIYRQLAAEHRTEPTHQIAWLEAELTSAFHTAGNDRDTHLKRVAEIHRNLAGNWPTNPGELYRLACYLTEQAPILLDAASTPSSTDADAATD